MVHKVWGCAATTLQSSFISLSSHKSNFHFVGKKELSL